MTDRHALPRAAGSIRLIGVKKNHRLSRWVAFFISLCYNNFRQRETNADNLLWKQEKKDRAATLSFFIIVFRLVRDVVANHKTTRYAGAATKVIQKNHLA